MIPSRRRVLAASGLLFAAFVVLALFVTTGRQATNAPDQWVADRLFHVAVDHPPLPSLARWVGHLAEPWCLRVVSFGWALWLWRGGHGRTAAWLVATMLIGGLLAILAKLLCARARPVWPDPITVPAGYSYPSGHATTAALFAGCLLVVLLPGAGRADRRWLLTAAVALPVLIGTDRLLLGVHFLSDVVGGYVLGSAVVLAMLAVPRTAASGDRRLARGPRRGHDP